MTKDLKAMTILITPEIYEELRKEAYITNKSMSSIVRDTLEEHYSKQK